MTYYLLRRLIQVPVLLLGVVTFNFILIHAAPGDPIVALAGEYGNAAYYEEMRARYGLDRPVPEQFVNYLTNVMRGDLGHSYGYGRPAATVILDRLPTTLLLIGTALIISTPAGIGLGTIAARWSDTPLDSAIRVVLLIGYALPVFWLAQLMMYLFAVRGGWFPTHGLTNAREQFSGVQLMLDVGHHLFLPAVALAAQQIALVGRLTRSEMLNELSQPYILTARAKGAGERIVYLSHALRNALLPVVTVVGGRLGFLFAGAVLTETVFAWPGLGRLLLEATQSRDYPVLMGMLILVSLAVILANLATDLMYAALDPRISYS